MFITSERINFYRPRSEESEGYVFTGVCHSVTNRGEVLHQLHHGIGHMVGEGEGEEGSAQHLPPGPGHNTSLPPRTRSQHPPQNQFTTPHSPLGPGHNTSPPPPDQVTTPPSPRTRSQHLPPPPDQVTTPPSPRTRSQHLPPHPGPGHNTSLPPQTRSQHLPPSSPRDYALAGGTHPTKMHSCLM